MLVEINLDSMYVVIYKLMYATLLNCWKFLRALSYQVEWSANSSMAFV